MRTQSIVLLAILLVAATCGGRGNLWFDYGRTRVNRSGDWNVVTIPCSGGSGSYAYSFDSVPLGWRVYGNQLYVPRSVSNKYYAVRVGVNDNIYGNTLRRAVVFNLGNTGVSDIFDTDYDYSIDNPVQFTALINQRQITIRIGTSSPAPTPAPVIPSTPSYNFPTDDEIDSRVRDGDVDWIRG